MEEQLITFETAKLAKEKGFDWGCNYFYTSNKKPYVTRGYEYQSDAYVENYNWNNGIGSYPTKASDVLCSAPTQSLLQKWLREVYDIDITVNSNNESRINRLYEAVIYSDLIEEESNEFSWFKTYEEALEDGLFEALKLIP